MLHFHLHPVSTIIPSTKTQIVRQKIRRINPSIQFVLLSMRQWPTPLTLDLDDASSLHRNHDPCFCPFWKPDSRLIRFPSSYWPNVAEKIYFSPFLPRLTLSNLDASALACVYHFGWLQKEKETVQAIHLGLQLPLNHSLSRQLTLTLHHLSFRLSF